MESRNLSEKQTKDSPPSRPNEKSKDSGQEGPKASGNG